MLEIVNYGQDEYGFPSLLVLGCFDAIHKGHADLLKKAKLQAKINGLDLGVMMFAEGKGGGQVFTFEERLAFLREYGVKFILKIDYTEDFMKIAALDFLKAVEDKINVKGYMSGKDFRFGAGAKGKSSTLKAYADNDDNGVWYTAVKDVTYGEEKISTTMIKSLLESGDVVLSGELLGRNYFVTGKVVKGSGRGASLGFPTMNITYPESKFKIKQGVYGVTCTIGEKAYKGIANYGPRPTFKDSAVCLEVHLDGFEGENYGDEVTVEFTSYIRDTQKFKNGKELKKQLSEDLEKIRQVTDD